MQEDNSKSTVQGSSRRVTVGQTDSQLGDGKDVGSMYMHPKTCKSRRIICGLYSKFSKPVEGLCDLSPLQFIEHLFYLLASWLVLYKKFTKSDIKHFLKFSKNSNTDQMK